MTADEIWKQVSTRFRGFNRTTAYRVLDFLVQADLVSRYCISAVARYELSSDFHHHLMCTKCHDIFPMEGTDFGGLVRAARSNMDSW